MKTRILVVGDSYCPSSVLRHAFGALEAAHEVMFADVIDEPSWLPTTPSELRIKEYMGSPRQVVDLHGGTITARNREGGGLEVVMSLGTA